MSEDKNLAIHSSTNVDLTDWEFERLYSRLFGTLVESSSTQDRRWRYDPFDSKYPSLDGILRGTLHSGQDVFREDYVLVQLKGTRCESSPSSLKGELKKAEQQINDVANSAAALLIGLVVSTEKGAEKIESAYIAAPAAQLKAVGLTKDTPIAGEDLIEKIASMIDARRSAAPQVSTLILTPSAQEIFFFQKGPDGWYSVSNGFIVGRDVSVNWTIPVAPSKTKCVSIAKNGTLHVEAVPVEFPHPPYREIPNSRLTQVPEIWEPPTVVQNRTNFYWVLQFQFTEEATVKVGVELGSR